MTQPITFITYQSGEEIIVTTPAGEAFTKKAYFDEPEDRDIEDYDRVEHFEGAVALKPSLRVKWG